MTFNANLVRAIQSTIRHNGPRPAILDGARTYSWAEFGGRVARLKKPFTEWPALSRLGQLDSTRRPEPCWPPRDPA